MSVFFGVIIATSLVTGAPVYMKALERLGFNTSVDRSSSFILNILTSASFVPLERDKLQRVEESVEKAMRGDLSPICREHQRYLRTDDYLMNPTQLLPKPKIAVMKLPQPALEAAEDRASLGYFINLWDLEDHVIILQGRMASDTISGAPSGGAVVEAMVGVALAQSYGLKVRDTLTLTPSLSERPMVSARIVGIVQPIDLKEEYWQGRASLFFDPPALEEVADPGVEIDSQQPPLALLITPAAAAKLPNQLVEPAEYRAALRGYFATVSNVEHHVTFLQGRMAGDTILHPGDEALGVEGGLGVPSSGLRGPLVEAVVGVPLADKYKLKVEDVLTLTPFIDESTWVSARIVGIAERTDLSDEYWQWGSNTFFNPFAEEGLPPLALLITREAMVEGVGRAYPGTSVGSIWSVFVDKEGLKELSIPEIRLRLTDFETKLSRSLPGQITSTGMKRLLTDFERQNFLASIPLLLLLTTMVLTVLYFLSMMVSYLVQRRENDIAQFRTRGAGTLQLLRLYALEGLVVAVVALVLAPFIAIGATALAGRLPYFSQLTGGDLLPVEIGLFPFLVAAGAGLLCLSIFVLPGVLGTRAGLVVHKLRSSRPPSVPFFQRYHLDIGLLVLGGLVFWELRSREQLVVGGLFTDVQVSETLLLAPVLFLTVVALLFMRFFPLLLRFLSGESPALLHLLVAATLAVLGLAIVAEGVRADNGLSWLAPVILVLALAGAYWATTRAGQVLSRLGGLVIQAALVAAVVVAEPPIPSEMKSVLNLALISIVPAQVAFLIFKASAQTVPVWVSLALWHMARNPLQYTWIVLLLVLVTGLATFSTTVGATLGNKDEDRIRYDVAADIRVTGVQAYVDGWALQESYRAVPGIESVSPAYRSEGLGPPTLRRSLEVLAVESRNFPSISWYRDDFSSRPLSGVMQALQSDAQVEQVAIPEDTTSLGMWAKLPGVSLPVDMKMVVQDGLGTMNTLTLGRLGDRDWQLMSADLPAGLEPPLHLVSVQVHSLPGLVGIPGMVLLDNLHAMVGPDGVEQVLEDFEGESRWTPIPTSLVTSDSVLSTADDAYRGKRAGVYSFGEGSNRDIGGIYKSPTGGPLPVVASSSFMAASGTGVGEVFVIEVNNMFIPSVIRDTVDYFPTMDPGDEGFILADMDLLLAHLNILAPGAVFTPNEFFLTLAPDAGRATREEISGVTPLFGQIRDRESLAEAQEESVRLDPLVTAGWRAMALLSLAIVVSIAAIGYVTYLLFFAARSRGEMGLLRSLGIGHRQMIAFLALQHLFIVAVGMGLGTWAGFQMSHLTVPSVSAIETGGSVVPPILVMTDWRVIVAVYSALVGTFAAILFVLTRGILRLDLQTISRVE